MGKSAMDSCDSAPAIDTVRAFLADLGEDSAIAAALNVPLTTVQSWSARNSVPPGYWYALIEMGKTRNPPRVAVTYERLALIHAKVLVLETTPA